MSSRLEIIVVAGIHNVGEDQDSEAIVKEMEELKKVVMEHSAEHNQFCSMKVPMERVGPQAQLCEQAGVHREGEQGCQGDEQEGWAELGQCLVN